MQTNTPGSLGDKFQNFGAAPTDQLWSSIASSLDQNEKKRRGLFWWWFAGIAASGTLLFGIYHLGYQAGKNETNLAEKNTNILPTKSETNLPETQPNVHPNNVTTNPDVPQQNLTDTDKQSDLNSNPSHFTAGISPSQGNTDEKEPMENTTVSFPPVELPSEKLSRLNDPAVQKIPQTHETNFSIQQAPEFEKSPQNNNWEFGFTIGSQTTSKSAVETLYTVPTNSLTTDFQLEENAIQGTSNSLNTSALSGTIKRPLSFDFTMAYSFGNRWSFQSGLGINYLKSVTHFNSIDLARVDASFLSLTIPMLAEFDFIKRKRFEFSTACGITHEIPVFSRSTSYNPLNESAGVSKSLINGYMCSGLFNIGINYRLNENLKIGFHPMVRHYFFQSMKSEYPVLEKKTWFGANIGLVWEL